MSIFTEVQQERIDRSTFNVSHTHLTSGNMGDLIPIYGEEVNPNEYFEITPYTLVKLQPLVFPVMGNISVETHFFYVPKRLLWDNWNNFITGNGEFVHPSLLYGTEPGNVKAQYGSAADYFGLPVGGPWGFSKYIDPSLLSAYMLIWNEYYRDQNISEELDYKLRDSGNHSNTDLLSMFSSVLKSAWMHDYFTSCLPYAQKGTAVLMPLTQTELIDVIYDKTGAPGAMALVRHDGTDIPSSQGLFVQDMGSYGYMRQEGYAKDLDLHPNGNLKVNINDEAIMMTTFRNAMALQAYLEQLARAGTRINEYIENIYGIRISDQRAQRPEFIGSSKSLVQVSEILSTANNESTPLAQFAGSANGANRGEKFSYRIEEHGYIVGILRVLPETMYSQGLHKKWTRLDRLDYFIPMFENIGEQAVYNYELHFGHAQPEDIFGYIPRNAEFKFTNSLITGDMKRSLSQFHFGRELPASVALNSDFIYANVTKEPFAVTSEDNHCLMIQSYLDIKATRPMQRFANPKLVG